MENVTVPGMVFLELGYTLRAPTVHTPWGGSQGVLAHRHWHRPGMALCAGHGHIIAHLTAGPGDNANRITFSFQDRTLFDMGFEQTVIRAVA